MKVVHIIETPGTGGAERVLVDVAIRLPAGMSSLGVMMCESWTGRELAKHGIPVTVMPLRRSFDIGWPVRFAEFLRRNQVAVVHSHEFTANVYASMGARIAGVPIVCTTHGKNYWPFARYRRLAYRWTAKSSACFVAVSHDLGSFLARVLAVPERRIQVILNGIDIASFAPSVASRERMRAELGLSERNRLLLACGELSEVKGHRVLLQAIPRVLERNPDLIVALAGDGPLRKELEKLVQDLRITSSVRFLGFRTDIPELLGAADLFVMPSLSEGLPLAILEAMAAELPVLASAVGGVPELIRHGRTGWLVRPGDSAALADELIGAMASPSSQVRRIVVAAAQLCREKYALSATVDAYVNCYHQAVGK